MVNPSEKKATPLIFNIFKPAGMTSCDVIRYFKRNLPRGFGKIGHIGTLDPFACGVLLLGVNGGTKLNDYVHKYMPKTYIAVGKLGVYSDTGDMTTDNLKFDQSKYLNEVISSFSLDFINKKIQEKFVGDYWQAPHQYSAAKFQGRPLHKWAREGVEIKKEPVLRQIYSLEVLKYNFPYLSLRVTTSSGTYIRSLFQDIGKFLGTYGSLVSLVRESIGQIGMTSSLKKGRWPIQGKQKDGQEWLKSEMGISIDSVLKLNGIFLKNREISQRYINGIPFDLNLPHEIEISNYNLTHNRKNYWIYDSNQSLLGMGMKNNSKGVDLIEPVFNLPQ